MSQQNLNRLGNEAKANYTSYTKAHDKHEKAASDLEVDQASAEAAVKFADIWRDELLTRTGEDTDYARERIKSNEDIYDDQQLRAANDTIAMVDSAASESQHLAEASEYFQDHEAPFHDLAVIEAHLAGVAIKVEQPLTIGQAVPVKVNRTK